MLFKILDIKRTADQLLQRGCFYTSSPSCEVDHRKKNKLEWDCSCLASSIQSKLPFKLLVVGKSSEGSDFQYTFDKTPKSGLVKTLVAPTKFMSNSFLAKDLKFTLKAGIYAGAYWEAIISSSEASRYASEFVNRLMRSTGETWYDDGGLSNAMKYTPEAQQLMRQISKEFRSQMSINLGDFSKVDLKYKGIIPPSFSWRSSPSLKILVGGTQQMYVRLDAICYDFYNCSYNALISVEIRDDFGVTESDITNASPSAKLGMGGLTDFWVLQHQRGKKPFTTVFTFFLLLWYFVRYFQ